MDSVVKGVKLGLDVLLESGAEILKGKRVGLITNPTGVTSHLDSNIEAFLKETNFKLVALFGPEHGVRGDAQAGDVVKNAVDEKTDLAEYSLYGETRKPTPEMLQGIDSLVFDIQDVGARFYTYPYTLVYAMEAAAESGKEILVLDRPNPITGTKVEGNIPDPDFPFYGMSHSIPIQHGLTIGEMALMFNGNIGCELTVIKMEGWSRDMWYDETGLKCWVMPSPNIPTLDTAVIYPGTCLLEGCNSSEGRGTTRPFELIGAPWIDPYGLAEELNGRHLPGVKFRPTYFTPVFEKHAGQRCGGVAIHVMERDELKAVTTGLHILDALRRMDPDKFSWRAFKDRYTIDRLCGTDQVRKGLEVGLSPDAIVASWDEPLSDFLIKREGYLLYE